MLSNTQAYTTHVPFFPLKSELRDICWMLCVLWCRSNQELKTQETTVSGMWEWAKSSWDNYSSGQEDCFPRRFFQSRLFSHLMTDTTYWEPKSLLGVGGMLRNSSLHEAHSWLAAMSPLARQQWTNWIIVSSQQNPSTKFPQLLPHMINDTLAFACS